MVNQYLIQILLAQLAFSTIFQSQLLDFDSKSTDRQPQDPNTDGQLKIGQLILNSLFVCPSILAYNCGHSPNAIDIQAVLGFGQFFPLQFQETCWSTNIEISSY